MLHFTQTTIILLQIISLVYKKKRALDQESEKEAKKSKKETVTDPFA